MAPKVNLARIDQLIRKYTEESVSLGIARREEFSAEQDAKRKAAIARWYTEGGHYFIEWSEKYYRRPPDGIPITWAEPYLKPFYSCFGNPWIEYLVCQKPAQVYFSETLVNFSAFALAELRSPVGFGFEREAKLRDMVGPRIQTAFDYIEPIRQIKQRRQELTGRADTDLKSRVMTVGGVTSTFFYASTSRKAGGSERQASSSISSWTGWIMLADEIELWPEGVIDVAKSRQLSFNPPSYPTRPFRAGSTPGHEGGVTDREVKTSDHYFQWRVTCPHCGTQQILDVFGNFLKGRETKSGELFLTPGGRPVDWWAHDDTNSLTKQKTAYVGCRHCGGEIDWDTRAGGEYWCTYTNERMSDLLSRACQERTKIRRAAIEITPLSSSRFQAPAALLELLSSKNPSDTIQQTLGKAVSIGSGKILLPVIQAAIARPVANFTTDQIFTVLGVDQGSEGNWVVATRWHLPIESRDAEDRWKDAFVEVLDYGMVSGFHGVDEWRRRFEATLVGIDGEPEKNLASDYARQTSDDLQYAPAKLYCPLPDGSYRVDVRLTNLLDQWLLTHGWQMKGDLLCPIRGFEKPIERIGPVIASYGGRFLDAIPETRERRVVYLFDQVYLRGEPFRYTTRNIQGQAVPVWSVDRTYGLDAVRDRFLRELIALPDGMIYNPSDQGNFILHLLSSDRTTNGRWVESPGQPDHYFHALNFAEMAVLCSGHEPDPGAGLVMKTLGVPR